jgi:flavodoxin
VHIGIIIYSRTGNTLSVASKLRERLAAARHTVTVERLETVGPDTLDGESAALKAVPPVEPYDALVLATPVRGGRPAPPLRSYLERAPSLAGKRVALLVTGFFPAAWGREQTLAELEASCASKGATVCGVGSVGWFSLRRRCQIAAAIDELSGQF